LVAILAATYVTAVETRLVKEMTRPKNRSRLLKKPQRRELETVLESMTSLYIFPPLPAFEIV